MGLLYNELRFIRRLFESKNDFTKPLLLVQHLSFLPLKNSLL